MAPRRQQCAQSREDAKKTLPIVWHIVKTHNRELALALSLCKRRDALRLTAQSRALKIGFGFAFVRNILSVSAKSQFGTWWFPWVVARSAFLFEFFI